MPEDKYALQEFTLHSNLGKRIEVHSIPWMIMGELKKDRKGRYFVSVAGGSAGYAEVMINGYTSLDRVEGILRLFL